MIDKVRFFRTPEGRYDVTTSEEYDILKWFLTEDVNLHPYSCRGLLLWIDAALDSRLTYKAWGGNLCYAYIYPEKTVIRYGMGKSDYENPDLMEISTREFRDIIQECLDFNIQQGRDITEEQIRYQIEEFNRSLEKNR